MDTLIRPSSCSSLSAAECPLPPCSLPLPTQRPQEQALPYNFHRPCCQSGLTLSLPVSPGWAEGGARLLPWGVVVGSAGPWGQRLAGFCQTSNLGAAASPAPPMEPQTWP